MSRREIWLSAAGIFLLALAARAVAAAAVSFPVPEDTAYYAGVARNLVDGRGLVSDALWSYQTSPLAVPRAAFEVWLPLPTLLAAIPIAIAGVANWFRAAQLVSVIAGAGVAVLAWRLGADVAAEMKLPVGRARTLAVGSGVAASFLGPLVVYGALPDSTALFAALSLAACLLMTRISARAADPTATVSAGTVRAVREPLIALGVVIGLAALTRSEAVWLGLAWAIVVWRWTPGSRRHRVALVMAPAIVAGLVFAPWAMRDWLVFGSPLPGQTLANALSVSGFDIFAYQQPPTLANYFAQGPAALLAMRVTGTAHNLFNVLVIPGFPVGLVGLVALPWVGRRAALRPLTLVAVLTLTITTLFFPVSTTWGTFLHAAGSIFVLLIVTCLVGLDGLIAAIGRFRHWTRPVAWLGPALAVAVALPLLSVQVVGLGRTARDVQARYQALPAAMARAGVPLAGAGPIVSDHPIWLAESAGVRTLALPEESPQSVLDLAHRFGATLVVQTDDRPQWPAVLSSDQTGARCFKELHLTDDLGHTPEEGTPLGQIHVFRIVCP